MVNGLENLSMREKVLAPRQGQLTPFLPSRLVILVMAVLGCSPSDSVDSTTEILSSDAGSEIVDSSSKRDLAFDFGFAADANEMTEDAWVMNDVLRDGAPMDAQPIDLPEQGVPPQDATTLDMTGLDRGVSTRDLGITDGRVLDAEAVPTDVGAVRQCEDGLQNGDETGVDCGGQCPGCVQRMLEVTPPVYSRALRNPMKGLTTNGVRIHEWASLAHVYIRWNELEERESDGIERIRRISDEKFSGVAERNVKVIPRVYLHWSGPDRKYWPSDMETDDYSSAQFQARLTRLVSRLGEVWNNDPRVAFVEMGIFGQWGEHHSPSPSPEMQALATRLFADAFPNKLISVRHAWNEFQGHDFGEYWDSFSHYDQMWPHGQSVRQMNVADARYRRHYIGGETAYDWGGWEIQPGSDPTDSVRDPVHRRFIINTIRWLHCTQLRWLHAYDVADEAARAGAEDIQRAMGYRFLLESVSFSPEVVDGRLRVSLTVRNEGSAPFYYDWPLQVSLLDGATREVVWRRTFDEVDIRDWLGGENWPDPQWIPRDNWPHFVAPDHWAEGPLAWQVPAPAHVVNQTFQIDHPPGTYLLALAVLDPAGQLPSLRFATSWYLNGGRHPVGLVTIGPGQGGPLPEDMVFHDPWLDQSLQYRP